MNSINKISGGLSEEKETRHGQQIATSPYTEANLLRNLNFEFHFDSCNKKLVRIARIWILKLLRDRAFLFFFHQRRPKKLARPAGPPVPARAHARARRMRARRAGRRCPLGPLVRWAGSAAGGVATENSVRPEPKIVKLLGMLPRFQLY